MSILLSSSFLFNSLFYFLISKEIKLQIKVCLLFAVSRNLPLRLLVKIWKYASASYSKSTFVMWATSHSSTSCS